MFFTRFDARTARAAPLSFLRAFHFLRFASVRVRSADASSGACFVNQPWLSAAAADMRFAGSTRSSEPMKPFASADTAAQNAGWSVADSDVAQGLTNDMRSRLAQGITIFNC